jgi:hypothetical protein
MQVGLCRRSDLRPIKKMGLSGQKCVTSGYHCQSYQYSGLIANAAGLTLSRTLSRELGQSMAKHTRRRFV